MKYGRRKKRNISKILIIILFLCATIYIYDNSYIYNFIINKKYNMNYYIKDSLFKKDVEISNIENYRSLKTNNDMLKNENDMLKSLLEIKNKYDYKVLFSKVIDRNINSWMMEMVIDLGKDDIKVNDAVLYNDYFIGYVIKVYDNYSLVKLVTSGELLSVKVRGKNDTYYYGSINEYKNNKLKVEGITNYNEISEGDILLTSGYGKVLGDLPIGSVNNIESDSYGISKILYISIPDINDISYVYVVRSSI